MTTTRTAHPTRTTRAAAAGVATLAALTACTQTPTKPPTGAPATVTATDKHGATLVSIAPDRVEVHHEGDATVTTSGKGWSTPEAAKISADADAFKLKDAGGTTAWKVKRGDKVKILRGEDEVRCEISTPEPGRFKVKSVTGKELGTVRAEGSGSRLQDGADTNLGTSPARPSAALAALFCTEVPAAPRAVIVGELARRDG